MKSIIQRMLSIDLFKEVLALRHSLNNQTNWTIISNSYRYLINRIRKKIANTN